MAGFFAAVGQPLVNPERSSLNEELEFVKHAREGPVNRLRKTLKQKLEKSDDAFAWDPKESWNGIEQRVKTLLRQRDDDFEHLNKYSKDFDELEVMMHKLIEVLDQQTKLLNKCSCKKSGANQSKSSDTEKELESVKAKYAELSAEHHKVSMKVKTERDNTARAELQISANEKKEKQMQQKQVDLKNKWKTEKKQVKQLMKEIEELRASRAAGGGSNNSTGGGGEVDDITLEKKLAQANEEFEKKQKQTKAEFDTREKQWLQAEKILKAEIESLKMEVESVKDPDMARLEIQASQALEDKYILENLLATKCGELEEVSHQASNQAKDLEEQERVNEELRIQMREFLSRLHDTTDGKEQAEQFAKDQISLLEKDIEIEKQRHAAKEKELETEIEKLKTIIEAKSLPASQLVMKYADLVSERNAFSSLCSVLKKQFDERHSTLRSSYQQKMEAWEADKEELQQAQYTVEKLSSEVAHKEKVHNTLKKRLEKINNLRKLDQDKIHELESQKHSTERDLASVRTLIDSVGGRARSISSP